MNDADLLKIRALNGSQHFAFEELCCQLASLEPRLPGDSFLRKGPGADAGVECYLRHANGTETGWQAKFHDCFDSKKISQLTESFQTAVEKHPQLNRYIVCLPIDLKDGRTGKNKTEGQRWEDWKTARLAELDVGRAMEIELWQATNIRERLYRHDPHYSGRMHFFFDEVHFSDDWFFQQFSTARDVLGARYTPQFHVSLPIRQAFRGISRDAWLEEQREGWLTQLVRHFNSLQTTLQRSDITVTDCEPVFDNGRNLINSLSQTCSLAELYPLADWYHQINQLKEHTRKCMEYFWHRNEQEERSKAEQDSQRDALNDLFKFEQILDDINQELQADAWRLSNEHAVLIYGDAGSGKSHLLADVADDALKIGCPAILLISSQFFLQDPRTQILERLDLRKIDFSAFLGALDAAGQAAGVRALLMIDALNERNGIELWPEYLAPLITEIRRYPHLALVVSCRTTYLGFILQPDSILRDSLPRLEHHGFANDGGRAARAYLAKRKIVRPSAPNLLPEFNNPLFLKTCCDSLDRQGLNTFPRGVQGLTQYFNFYLKALSDKVESRMKLDKRQKIIERALSKLTECLLIQQSSYLPLNETLSCLESVFPSMGQQDRSLLSELEHEGIITVEPVYTSDHQQDEQVRFTFERFSDFQIAGYLLQQHIEGGYAFQPLEPNTPLHDFLARKDIFRFAGIIEALAVLLPESTDFELLDLSLPEKFSYGWVLEEAFLTSLLLRRQDRFTEKTRQLVIGLSTDYSDHWFTTLIAVSTEPENQFNAHFIDNKLKALSMPERDAKWSVAIAGLNTEEGSPLDVLLSWALESGFDEIDPVRSELAAILLTWLFSSSHRTIRDRATKSLSALLATRLPLAVQLIEQFKQVDDLYVLERLLAACYGAALQAKTQEGLGELAMNVYQWLFADGKPPVHLLLRDYGRGIVEYAYHCGLLPTSIVMEQVRPPYQSDWPIGYVAEEDLAIYGDTFNDHIVQSASSEWTGDFAKYIIKPAVGYWTATSLYSDEALTPHRNFEIFCSMLTDNGTSEQIRAFTEMLAFSMDSRKQEFSKDSGDSLESKPAAHVKIKFVSPSDDDWQRKKQNEEKFNELEKKFILLLEDNYKYEYWTGARHGIMEPLNQFTNNRPEKFDVLLAQRWVTKRAHELGWSTELFGVFDGRIGTGRGRQNKHIERIGKKYQWLALYELLARMADNLIYDSGYRDEDGAYDGPWQMSERNIDPSLLIDKTQDDGWAKHPSVWWSPQTLKLRHLNREEQSLWLQNENDQMNSASLLNVTDPETKQRWLVLKGFKHYSTPYDTGSHIDSWCRNWCIVVKKPYRNQFVKAVSEHTLIDPRALPELGDFYHAFIGEYPWHPAYALEDNWTKIDRDYSYRYKVLPTVGEYKAEKGGYDRSIESYISAYLPAPWLIEKLGLRLVDGHNLYYADHTGRTLFKDPSIHESGPSTALIDRTAFLDLLDRENLAPVWIIAGEKGAYGEGHDDFIGRRIHSFVYVLNDSNEIVCAKQTVKMEHPLQSI